MTSCGENCRPFWGATSKRDTLESLGNYSLTMKNTSNLIASFDSPSTTVQRTADPADAPVDGQAADVAATTATAATVALLMRL